MKEAKQFKTVSISEERYNKMIESYDRVIQKLEAVEKELEELKRGIKYVC